MHVHTPSSLPSRRYRRRRRKRYVLLFTEMKGEETWSNYIFETATGGFFRKNEIFTKNISSPTRTRTSERARVLDVTLILHRRAKRGRLKSSIIFPVRGYPNKYYISCEFASTPFSLFLSFSLFHFFTFSLSLSLSTSGTQAREGAAYARCS